MYTYKDFEDKVKEYGFTPDQISEADYRLAQQNADAGVALLGYKHDWLTATNDSAKAMAHAAAEDIRSRYGNYSGGGDGGSFTPTGTAQYEDPWEQTIQSTVRNLQNKKFEWSPETDPTVKYYEDAYRREGERAMKDTLGAVAATTGGIPSSYATVAAAQQRNYYAQQMADKYPELYKQAFDQFMQEYDNDYRMLEMYSQLSRDETDKWYKEQDIGLRGRDLDITENQYSAQNEIAWAEIGLQDKDIQQKYNLAYAQLNQDDRHFVDELLYKYDVLSEEGKQFWAKLAQDGKIADAELQYKYDALDQDTKNFLMEYALDVDKLEFEKDVHADEVRLTEAEIKLQYDKMDADKQEHLRNLAFSYYELAQQASQWSEEQKLRAKELGIEADKIKMSASLQEWETAAAAAEFGDFSYLKKLGVNTDSYEALWNAKVEGTLNPEEEELPTEDDIPEDVVDAVAGQNTNSTTTTTDTSDPSFIGPKKTGAEFTNIEDIIGKANAGFELTENEKAILAKNNRGTKESNTEFTNINDIIAKAMNGYKLTPREQAIFDKYTAKTFTK